MTVAISIDDLWIPDVANGSPRRPIESLSKATDHVHGRLSVVIGGREIPHLGYFGPSDVCLGAWAKELRAMLVELSKSERARYVYDEGEQGQPAFQFARHARKLEVSVIDSEIAGKGDPDWGVQVCDLKEFCREVVEFLAALRSFLERVSPSLAAEWWTHWVG